MNDCNSERAWASIAELQKIDLNNEFNKQSKDEFNILFVWQFFGSECTVDACGKHRVENVRILNTQV
jgi:hypothetical protein